MSSEQTSATSEFKQSDKKFIITDEFRKLLGDCFLVNYACMANWEKRAYGDFTNLTYRYENQYHDFLKPRFVKLIDDIRTILNSVKLRDIPYNDLEQILEGLYLKDVQDKEFQDWLRRLPLIDMMTEKYQKEKISSFLSHLIYKCDL